ncbi:alpha-ketoglutarate-dependent dioxygenase AlkB [Hyphobacterium marinum]|uniref:Alpha-ketoglutarate-dependent dioxygenase AlkB n=1 Tax=Hyphobacterium marinum TaxID=3116574 RepID=A0ABU7LUJ0_9PROT|nr:alpha-ketoglutarate-dependent dioxygenase AlkB [Hyphobacterium sp. Y6023]MEE2565220.1 alpha-ketoglutarate-dependent dioxygenase AlkB [Hyphobacterium sp. Y6023]
MQAQSLPPGARFIPHFVTETVAARLLAAIDGNSWQSDLKRRVQHYGWRYDYRARAIDRSMRLGPLPDWLLPLAASVCRAGGFDREPDQVIVNEYLPGQGISAHIDCKPCFGPVIASLSLGGRAQMVFRHRGTGEVANHILEPRSLLVLSGAARHDWTHAIPARKSDLIEGVRRPRTRRVSLTFRTVRV